MKQSNVALYMRVSTKDQTLENQSLQLSKYCELKGWKVAGEYKDVISGSKEGIQAAMEFAKSKGAKRVVELSVSGAFHSPLMAPIVDEFRLKLDETHMQMGRIPVYANVTAKPVSNDKEIESLLHHQLTHPVRWVETIQNMVKDGCSRFIEVGSGKVLSGLVKRIDKDVVVDQCGTVEDLARIG